jgi:hypothetical protein
MIATAESIPTPSLSAGNVITAATHVYQGALLLERARRASLSGRQAARLAALAADLRDVGQAIERIGREGSR